MKTSDSIQKIAKIAGTAYQLIIITSLIALVIGPIKLIVEGDTSASTTNIVSNPLPYMLGAAYDLIIYIRVIILSMVLYQILKAVDQTTALISLMRRFREALIVTIPVVCSLLVLRFVNLNDQSGLIMEFVDFLFAIKGIILKIVFVLLGFISILFCFLFFSIGHTIFNDFRQVWD